MTLNITALVAAVEATSPGKRGAHRDVTVTLAAGLTPSGLGGSEGSGGQKVASSRPRHHLSDRNGLRQDLGLGRCPPAARGVVLGPCPWC